MSMEGPPVPPEKKEEEPITDEQAQEFYRGGNQEKFKEWIDQQQVRIEAYPGNPTYARMFFEQKLARIQFAAGQVADAIERVEDLAYQASQEADNLEKVGNQEYAQQMRMMEGGFDDLLEEFRRS